MSSAVDGEQSIFRIPFESSATVARDIAIRVVGERVARAGDVNRVRICTRSSAIVGRLDLNGIASAGERGRPGKAVVGGNTG